MKNSQHNESQKSQKKNAKCTFLKKNKTCNFKSIIQCYPYVWVAALYGDNAQQTIHDYIGSLTFMRNGPKCTFYGSSCNYCAPNYINTLLWFFFSEINRFYNVSVKRLASKCPRVEFFKLFCWTKVHLVLHLPFPLIGVCTV